MEDDGKLGSGVKEKCVDYCFVWVRWKFFFFHEAVLLMDIFEVSDSQTCGRFEKGETLQEMSFRLNGLSDRAV